MKIILIKVQFPCNVSLKTSNLITENFKWGKTGIFELLRRSFDH